MGKKHEWRLQFDQISPPGFALSIPFRLHQRGGLGPEATNALTMAYMTLYDTDQILYENFWSSTT